MLVLASLLLGCGGNDDSNGPASCDCTAPNEACVDRVDDGSKFCALAPATNCEVTMDPVCDGQVLHECDADAGYVVARDCAAEGLTCNDNNEAGTNECS